MHRGETMSDGKTSSAFLAPFQLIARDIAMLFKVPLAFFGSMFGTLALCIGTVVALWVFDAGQADAEDELTLEFEPGTLVRIGKKMEEQDIPEKLIVEETVAAESEPTPEPPKSEEAVTKNNDPPPKKKDPPKEKEPPKQKPRERPDPRKKGAKESDHNQDKNTPYDDLPTVDELPGDPFGDPGGWAALKKEGDPWATGVMAALNNMKIPAYAAKAKNGQYRFEMKVCKDGTVSQVYQKQSTGDAQLDEAIKAEILQLKVPTPSSKVLKMMQSSCMKLKYRFVWTGGKVQ